MINKKTFKTLTREGEKFTLLTLPNTNYFKFEIRNEYGSNIERVVNEKTGKNVYGIAHFIEHLSFKSTKDFTSKELWSIGKNEGVFNAITNYNNINYWFKTTSDKTDLAIKFVCNIALNDLTRVTQEEFKTEKSVVYNEAKRLYDNAQLLFYKQATSTMLGYELEDNIIGIPETIETFMLEDAIAVKHLFLTNNQNNYNITYDNTLITEDEIIQKVLTAIKEFEITKKGSLSISHQEYLSALKKPQMGDFKIESQAKQAMTAIVMDTVENTIVSAMAIQYLSHFAENSSLDDVIRQQHGLTYGIDLYLRNIAYKPYIQFSCDVSVGKEQQLMDLFKESINLSADALSQQRYEKLMKTIELKRVLQNLDLTSHDIWFVYHYLRPKDLDEVKALLAKDIDAADTYVETEMVTYTRLKNAVEKIRKSVNSESFAKVCS